MSRKRPIAKKWRDGESEWGRKKPRRFTRREPRRRSASTPRRAIAACGSSWSEASRRSRRSRCGSPSPRTWHAVSLSNRNQDEYLFLASRHILARFFHSLRGRDRDRGEDRPARGRSRIGAKTRAL